MIKTCGQSPMPDRPVSARNITSTLERDVLLVNTQDLVGRAYEIGLGSWVQVAVYLPELPVCLCQVNIIDYRRRENWRQFE